MSTVVWDGLSLAADSSISGNGVKIGKVSKIKRVGDDLVAFVGSYERGLLLWQWYEDGAKPEDWPAWQTEQDFTTLIVVKDRKCYEYESFPVAQHIDGPRAFGSGWQLALGALAMGANAEDAVRAAARYDIYTNDDVKVYYVVV